MRAVIATLLVLSATQVFASGIWDKGSVVGGILDFREVMPDVLYRGGSGGGRTPLNNSQLQYLCSEGVGASYYLYSKGFRGNSEHSCNGNSMSYRQKNWNDSGMLEVHRAVHSSIKSGQRPVFIHCWYGIHATGMVAATALMQFCDVDAETAVKYWKVGIAPSLQYPKVIAMIRNFKANPALKLSSAEKSRYCPRM